MFTVFVLAVAAYFVYALGKTEKAVVLLPLFFPLYLFKVDFFGVPFTLIEAFIYSCFLAIIVKFVFGYFKRNGEQVAHLKKFFAENRLFVFAVLMLVISAVISTFITPEKTIMLDGGTVYFGRKIALGILKGWVVCPLLFFGLIVLVLRKKRHAEQMMNFYVASAFILSFWGLMQVLTGFFITPDARASGPFESANYLALYISPAIVYMLFKIKNKVFDSSYRHIYALFKNPQLLWDIFIFLLLFLGLLFSKSYAAMFAVFIAASFFILVEYLEYLKLKGGFKFSWRLLLTVATGLLLILMIVFVVDPGKWNNLFKFSNRNSSSVRVEVYTIAVNLAKENWLTGIGLGQFPVRYQLDSQRILGHLPYELNMLHAHNLYLSMWLNLGLLGLISFSLILFSCFKAFVLAFKSDDFKKNRSLSKFRFAGFCLLLIILVHGFLDTPFFKNDLALLFWLIVSVIIISKDEQLKS